MARKTKKQKALAKAARELFGVNLDFDLVDFKLQNILDDLEEEVGEEVHFNSYYIRVKGVKLALKNFSTEVSSLVKDIDKEGGC